MDCGVLAIILRLLTFSDSITLLKEMTHTGLHSKILNYKWFLRVHTSFFSYYL